MNTATFDLHNVIPHSEGTDIDFVRIEMLRGEYSPLAVVWYRTPDQPEPTGARIDLQKQAFLDDFGSVDRAMLNAEAKLIVHFVRDCLQRTVSAPAVAVAW
jgi:hypothetical protein